MIYIPNDSNNPYFNLAFEEFCLGALKTNDTYFILWQNAPAVIFGRNQDLFQEVDYKYAHANNIYLVRRITGGGAVYHDLGNLNISIMGNYKLHPDYDQEYGRFMTEALRNIGLKGVEMNGRNDLSVSGKKISGWAKRIQGDSFLLHGTLLYDVDLDQLERVLQVQTGKMQRKAVKSVLSVVRNIREMLPFENLDGLRVALEKEMRGSDEVIQLGGGELATITELVTTKYETEQWIFNLTFEPTISESFKVACGTIIVNVLLNGGLIEAIVFRGDFLGNKDTDELSRLLKGIQWSREAVAVTVTDIPIYEYFTGMTNEEFLCLIERLI